MRLFRKKSDPPAHQEYLDGLISSIRQARREGEEKPGLQSFIEEDNFPAAMRPGDGRVTPEMAGRAGASDSSQQLEQDAEEIANLEAYLAKLNQNASPEQDDAGQDGSGQEPGQPAG